MRRTARLPLPLLLTALLLAGCTDPSPMPTPPPTPSQTPVFASDEEALAAATEAYGKFLATVDLIFNDGGENPERLLEVASEDVLEQESPGFQQLRENDLRGTGSATATLTLQAADLVRGEATVYVCEDIQNTDVVDSAGASVVPADRINLYQYEVALAGDPLIVQTREPWIGASVCGA